MPTADPAVLEKAIGKAKIWNQVLEWIDMDEYQGTPRLTAAPLLGGHIVCGRMWKRASAVLEKRYLEGENLEPGVGKIARDENQETDSRGR
jgi:hypothetical protein